MENEIAPKATGIKKFGVYFMLPTIAKTVGDYLDKLKSIMPSMFDESGRVKITEIYDNAKAAYQKSGQFEFMGIIFNETDIDSLYNHIKSVSGV